MNGRDRQPVKTARARASARPAPERTCIVTRRARPRGELLRFVRDPQGRVVFDLKGDLPGRGAWVTPERAALEEAAGRNLFARAFKAQTAVDADLVGETVRQLEEAALSALSMARKAGETVSGFTKAASLLESGRAAVLISASDGAADGRRKLAGKLKKSGMDGEIVDSFTSAQLSLAFSRPNVIHAAMTRGGLADKFVKLARQAKALRAGNDPLAVTGIPEQSEQ